MNPSNTETVAALYAALAEQNPAALFGAASDDIVITQTPELPWGGTYHGRPGLSAFLMQLVRCVQSTVEVQECFETGEQVVVIGRTVGEVRATQARFTVRAVHVWTLRNGKVTRFEPYLDTPSMRRALASRAEATAA